MKNWDFTEFWRKHYKLIAKELYFEWALDFFGVKEFDEYIWLDEDKKLELDDWFLSITVDTMIYRWDFSDPLPELIFKVFSYLTITSQNDTERLDHLMVVLWRAYPEIGLNTRDDIDKDMFPTF